MTDEELKDREALFELVRMERFLRDQGQFDRMAALFTTDARVHVTWFKGSAADFIAQSRDQADRVAAARAGRPGSRAKHLIFPIYARTAAASRALVESHGQIQSRGSLGGVEVDTVSHCRFLSRARRDGADWKLVSLDCIYQWDTLAPVVPGIQPTLDRGALESARPTYRFLTAMLAQYGYVVDQEMAGDDRPDLVEALYRRAERWLESGEDG